MIGSKKAQFLSNSQLRLNLAQAASSNSQEQWIITRQTTPPTFGDIGRDRYGGSS